MGSIKELHKVNKVSYSHQIQNTYEIENPNIPKTVTVVKDPPPLALFQQEFKTRVAQDQ